MKTPTVPYVPDRLMDALLDHLQGIDDALFPHVDNYPYRLAFREGQRSVLDVLSRWKDEAENQTPDQVDVISNVHVQQAGRTGNNLGSTPGDTRTRGRRG